MTEKQKTFLFSLLFAFGQILLPSLTFPDSGENQEEGVYTLGEIVVQGKTEGVEATGTVHKITAEDIRDSGARTVVEAIDLLPGVDVFTGGNGVPRINIRGFRTRHVLFLLDGIPLNSAYDQQFDASLIPVEHIARIKMTVGPNSVLYGQGGAGGVINIISKKGTRKLRSMAGGEVGEGDAYLGKASVSGGSEKYDFFLSGSVYNRDSYPLSKDFETTVQEDGGSRENSDRKKYNFFTNIGYEVNDELTLGLTFSYTSGEYGIPGGTITELSDIYAPNSKYARMDDFDGFSLQLAGEYCPSESFSLRSWAFVNQMDEDNNRYLSSDYDEWLSRYDQRTNVKGLSLQPKYDLGEKGCITMGLSFEQDRWKSKGEVKDHLAGWPQAWVIEYPKNNKKFDVYSLSVEYEIMPTPELGLVFGYGYHNQNRDETDDSDNSFLVGAHYDATETLRLKAAFQRNIRFPSLRQLYDDDAGNENLKTERVNHYTMGLELKLPRKTFVSINVFESIAKNFIEKENSISEFYDNYGKYEFRGGEMAVEVRAIENLMVRTSYSYLHTKDHSDSGKDELQNRPETRIVLESRYGFDFGLSSYLSLLYVARQYYYSRDGSLEQAEHKAYTLVNVKLDQTVLNDRVNMYAGVDNVFDELYEQSYALPQAGRFIYGGMEVRF